MRGGPCNEHESPRVYIAAPFFNPEQRDAVAQVVEICHQHGYVTYSPERDGITLAPNASEDDRRQVYLSNVAAIQRADVVVAIVDDKDTGTTWEFGGANMIGTPVISISARTHRRNVMLSEGVVAHVETYQHLGDVLQIMRPFWVYGRRMTTELQELQSRTEAQLRLTFRYTGATQ